MDVKDTFDRSMQQPMPRIAVFGDVMLDQHIACEVAGFSPEDDLAPKLRPVGKAKKSLGGAANTAANLISLGCEVDLFSLVGMDEAGRQLSGLWYDMGGHGMLLRSPDRVTTMKTRFITPHGRHAFRFDEERCEPAEGGALVSLERAIKQYDKKYDAVVISDYGKGLMDMRMCALAHWLKGEPKVFVDPKGVEFWKYAPLYVLKPNRAEREAVRTVEAQRTHGDQVENAYFGVGIPHDTPWLVVTEGPSGCVLSGKDSLHPPRSLPVRFRTSGDPTGCGDTFMAAMVATWCRCLTIFGQNDERALEAGCRVGNAAAACVMDHVGAHIVTPAEVSAELATFDYGMTNDDRSAPQQGGPKT